MSMMQNKELVRSYIEELFNQGNFSAVDKYLSPSFIDHNPFTKELPMGPKGQAEFSRLMREAFADFHVDIQDIIAEGDKVANRITASGRHKGEFLGIAPTQKEVSWQVMAFLRVENGKIVERWATQDLMGLLKELGVAPEKMVPAGVR